MSLVDQPVLPLFALANAAAKIAVFAASILSALIGVAVLWGAGRGNDAAVK